MSKTNGKGPKSDSKSDFIPNPENQEGYVKLGDHIFPIIKSSDDPHFQSTLKSDNPIIFDELAEGIVIIYAIDLGDHLEMIAQSHLEKFGLKHQDIKLVAERNIRLKIRENCQISKIDLSRQIKDARPFFQVEMDNNLNPSIMIVDEFWEQAEKIADSKLLAVNIPAKNLLFFSDKNEISSFVAMKSFAQQMYKASQNDHIELTNNTYLRKNGQWLLYLDNSE